MATSAAVAGGAAALAAGCGDGKRTGGAVTPAATAPMEPGTAIRGGVLRTYNFDALSPETFDPHVISGGPVVNMHAAIFSKLLRYENERTSAIATDLVQALPEQPDELTYVLKLREGVTFHDTLQAQLAFPQVAGRRLTSADVRYSIERQTVESRGQARFGRKSQFAGVERIETPDDLTVRIKLKSPLAPFSAFLAGRNAFILPREIIDAGSGEALGAASMIGSGPFVLESFEPGFAVKLRRNANWFARGDATDGARPYLDGYDAFLSPQEDNFQREAFEGRAVDSTEFLAPDALERARTTNLGDILVEEADAGAVVATRLLIDRPPFNDARVRRALHLAIDRRALSALLYPPLSGGEASARLSGPISPGAVQWALPEEDLLRRPGYVEDRREALAEAKQLWSSATGDAPVTDIRAVFAGVPRTIPDVAVAALQRQLSEAFGLNVVPQVDPSGGALIAAGLRLNREGASEGTIAFTLALEDGGVDLDDWVYTQFRSGEPGNTYRLQDATLDALLDAQRVEFDADVRRKLGIDIQEYLLANVNARIEYMAPVRRRLAWGYARNYRLPMWYGSDFDLADTWLDSSHTAWVGRPA